MTVKKLRTASERSDEREDDRADENAEGDFMNASNEYVWELGGDQLNAAGKHSVRHWRNPRRDNCAGCSTSLRSPLREQREVSCMTHPC